MNILNGYIQLCEVSSVSLHPFYNLHLQEIMKDRSKDRVISIYFPTSLFAGGMTRHV